MGTTASIIINGKPYDTATGLPIETGGTPIHVTDSTQSHPINVARSEPKSHHAKPHHSSTLRRDIVVKPHGPHDHAPGQHHTHAHVTKSPSISKFAPHPVVSTPTTVASPEAQPRLVSAVHHDHATKKHHETPKPALSSRELKNHLIKTQLAAAKPNHAAPKKTSRLHMPARVSSIMAACLAVMLLGGYLSYINMPHLSVRVAAAQAGIDASYPSYTPSGYSFDGPVAYSDGQVTLGFAANGGTASYKITEKRTSWDSESVLVNLVASSTSSYDTTASGGLTIYTYGNNAAWVNAGTLYTIEGNAPLGTDQIVKIAQSL